MFKNKSLLEAMVILVISLLLSIASKATDYDSLARQLPQMNPKEKLSALISLGEHYKNRNGFEAIKYLNEAVSLSKKAKSFSEEAMAYKLLGLSYYHMSEHDNALEKLSISLALYRSLNDSSGVANVLHNTAMCYRRMERYEEALKLHLEVLKIDEGEYNKKGIAYDYNHIGMVFQHIGEHNKAKSYFYKGLSIREKIGHTEGVGYSSLSLASNCVSRKLYDSASYFYQKAKMIFKELEDDNRVAICTYGLGNIHWYNDNFKEAKKYYEASLMVRKRMFDWDGVIRCTHAIGLSETKLGNYSLAEEKYFNVLQVMEEHDLEFPKKRQNIYSDLSTNYVRQGDYEKALAYHKKFHEAGIEILSSEQRERIAEIDSKYSLEKSEAELAILKERNAFLETKQKLSNTIMYLIVGVVTLAGLAIFYVYRLRLKNIRVLKMKNLELEKINKALDRFVYSVSHDLKAPIASSKGLITLIRMEAISEIVHNYLNLQEKSVVKLEDLIAEILDYSKNNRSEIRIQQLSLDEVIEDVMRKFEHDPESKKVKKIFEINAEAPFYSDFIRLSVVLSNLVSNAIRYQNPFVEVPFLKIAANISTEKAIIEIEDNGLGILEEHQHKIFDMFYRAHSHRNGSGLGLFIVKEAVERLGGTIQFVSEQGKGTCFKVELPNSFKGNEAVQPQSSKVPIAL